MGVFGCFATKYVSPVSRDAKIYTRKQPRNLSEMLTGCGAIFVPTCADLFAHRGPGARGSIGR